MTTDDRKSQTSRKNDGSHTHLWRTRPNLILMTKRPEHTHTRAQVLNVAAPLSRDPLPRDAAARPRTRCTALSAASIGRPTWAWDPSRSAGIMSPRAAKGLLDRPGSDVPAFSFRRKKGEKGSPAALHDENLGNNMHARPHTCYSLLTVPRYCIRLLMAAWAPRFTRPNTHRKEA
jgi:hypothetical protein